MIMFHELINELYARRILGVTNGCFASLFLSESVRMAAILHIVCFSSPEPDDLLFTAVGGNGPVLIFKRHYYEAIRPIGRE